MIPFDEHESGIKNGLVCGSLKLKLIERLFHKVKLSG